MEDSGKKGFDRKINLRCEPCSYRNICKRADGLCTECNEYICKACFYTHKQFKVCRGHTLTILQKAFVKNDLEEKFEKCDQLIDFYCPQHEQVGYRDCMIPEHKTCQIEYIPDKASSFEHVKDCPEFKSMIKRAERYLREAKELSTFIKKNKKKAADINEKLIQDVNMFKEEIFSHVHKLTNAILKQGENIKAKDIETMDALEQENKNSIIELSRMSEVLESQTDQPQKLFIRSILQKPKLNQLREQLDNTQVRNKIEIYKFQRYNNLERSVNDFTQLGSIQRIKQRNKTDIIYERGVLMKPKVVAPMPQVSVARNPQMTQASVSKKPQPLLDRQLICRNIAVDGECLSYMVKDRGDVGLYVSEHTNYFEVEIISMAKRGKIAIGVVPTDYPDDLLPGLGRDSIGYHAGDGLLYYESGTEKKFGPKFSVNDKIGCSIYRSRSVGLSWDYSVEFARNGRKIREEKFSSKYKLYPAVGMHSAGEKVKVILNAKMPW